MRRRLPERTFTPMHENITPYEQPGQEEGEYVLEERTRDYIRSRSVERTDGPSENAD